METGKISEHWSRENIAWLSGLIEGEGCFQVKTGSSINIIIQMTDKDVLDRAGYIAGCGKVVGPYKTIKSHHKPCWRWKVSNSEHAYALLVAIYPFMASRRSVKIRELVAAYISGGPFKTKMHGTRAKYQRGCRCSLCAEGSRAYLKTIKKRNDAPVLGMIVPVLGYKYLKASSGGATP